MSLTLSKIFTFYVVYGTFKAVTKSLKSCLSWKFQGSPYLGSGWENPDRWSARDEPIGFKDFRFRIAERLEKK